jgi:hypothetical protein
VGGDVRGSSSLPSIKIASAGTLLELQIEVRTASAVHGNWDKARMRGSKVIQPSTDVPLQRVGQVSYLSLTIDAALLHPGS